ncbi:MAG: hypothetical protein M3Q42_13780 [Pseudomonadota bacterium]|nr:hypothetical protein [Pseudomonadota bacterium]
MTTALALALACASGGASALGLGQIELKSKQGEPLLAEIAIVSSDPAELHQLRAGLASPDTFTRVGLDPPSGTISTLRFEPALNDAGESVIRVTSAQPIDQSVLTFLIEVDWGQGRLVREYSTLLDAPRTVSAPLQPSVEAPVVAPSNAIVRAPDIAPPPEPEPDSAEPLDPGREKDAVAALEADAQPEPRPQPEPAPQPAPAPVARAAPAGSADRAPGEYGAVAAGETLSQIAGGLGLGVSLDQAMIALLRANPDAFINDNINLLKQGVVLRVPEREEMVSLGRAEASALVQMQVRQWRQARTAAQPTADSVANAGPPANAGQPPIQAASGARLEIVPPGAGSATQAGTQSGIAAGGEGEMLRQELIQTRETLAAKEAELAEMQSRVAELEKLQNDQQKLLSMKDTQLAAAQQRLGTAETVAPAPETARSSTLPWILGGIVLVLALIAGWAMRRRRTSAPVFPSPPERPRTSLADAFAPTAQSPEAEQTHARKPLDRPVIETPAQAETTQAEPATGAGGTLPLWDRGDRKPRSPVRAPPVAATSTPAWHDPGAATSAAHGDATPREGTPQAASEGLERARAYLELGDHVSARVLLVEIVASGDLDHSRQAARMLHELG